MPSIPNSLKNAANRVRSAPGNIRSRFRGNQNIGNVKNPNLDPKLKGQAAELNRQFVAYENQAIRTLQSLGERLRTEHDAAVAEIRNLRIQVMKDSDIYKYLAEFKKGTNAEILGISDYFKREQNALVTYRQWAQVNSDVRRANKVKSPKEAEGALKQIESSIQTFVDHQRKVESKLSQLTQTVQAHAGDIQRQVGVVRNMEADLRKSLDALAKAGQIFTAAGQTPSLDTLPIPKLEEIKKEIRAVWDLFQKHLSQIEELKKIQNNVRTKILPEIDREAVDLRNMVETGKNNRQQLEMMLKHFHEMLQKFK